MTPKPIGPLDAHSESIRALNEMNEVMGTIQLPKLNAPELSGSILNPAEWAYKRLGEYIKDFESKLDNEHEIGARLVSFGQSLTFHIESVGYYGPDIINFNCINEAGERVQLIQHISQLSVLLVAMKKREDRPRRIGYIWEEKNEGGKNF